MRFVTILLLAAIVLAPLAAAQSAFTVPSWVGVKAATTYDSYLFSYNATTPSQPVHMQHIYDVADIPIMAAPLKAMAFRRSSYVGNTHYAAQATVNVILSIGPNDSTTASTTFANNLGPNQMSVFSGIINLPPEPYSNNPPFNVVIPFTMMFPFAAAAGKSLVVDVTCTNLAFPGTAATWYRDAFQSNTGARTNNGSTWSKCLFSNGKYSSSIGHSNPYVGGTWYVYYYNTPANPVGIGAIGLQGVGGSWGGLTLPLDFGPLGAPGCGWSCDVIFTTALIAGGTATSPHADWPRIPVPNDPVLGGASFYDQAVVLDPPANALGLVSCWSSKWTIGDNVPPPGCIIYKSADTTPPSPTGSKQAKAVSAQFMY